MNDSSLILEEDDTCHSLYIKLRSIRSAVVFLEPIILAFEHKIPKPIRLIDVYKTLSPRDALYWPAIELAFFESPICGTNEPLAVFKNDQIRFSHIAKIIGRVADPRKSLSTLFENLPDVQKYNAYLASNPSVDRTLTDETHPTALPLCHPRRKKIISPKSNAASFDPTISEPAGNDDLATFSVQSLREVAGELFRNLRIDSGYEDNITLAERILPKGSAAAKMLSHMLDRVERADPVDPKKIITLITKAGALFGKLDEARRSQLYAISRQLSVTVS